MDNNGMNNNVNSDMNSSPNNGMNNVTTDMNASVNNSMNNNVTFDMNASTNNVNTNVNNDKSNNLVRFLLTFFLGWIGSLIINHTSLKPTGYKSRTTAYFFLSIVTFGIYQLVASISNLKFDPAKEKNIGYAKEV